MILALLLSSVVVGGAGPKEDLFREFVEEVTDHYLMATPKISFEEEQFLKGAGAWVLPCLEFTCRDVVYVHHPSLVRANRWWTRYMAYHEVCHIKLGHTRPGADISPQGLRRGEAAAEKCTEETMDWAFRNGGWDLFIESFPCGDGPVPIHVQKALKKRGKTCAP